MNATGSRLQDQAAHPSPQKARVSPWVVWSGLLLAPLAFSLQVSGGYAIAAQLCAGAGRPQPWLLLLSLVSLLLAAVGVVAASAAWRATRGEKGGGAGALADRGEGRTRFMGMFGMTSSALLLAGVLMISVSQLFFGACPGVPAG